MDYNISAYIGQRVRRLVVYIEHSLTHNKKLICSVIEKLENDMVDFDEKVSCRESDVDPVTSYKVCLLFDYVELTNDLLVSDQKCIYVNDEKIDFIASDLVMEPNLNQAMLLNMDTLKKYELNSLFPKRGCSAFVNCLIDKNRCVQSFLSSNPTIIDKITEVTNGLTDLELSETPQHWGNLYFIAYNPVFRNVDIMTSSEPFGIILRFDYRNIGACCSLKVLVTDFHHGDIPVSESLKNVENGSRYVFVPTPSLPNSVNIRITDENGHLLYFRQGMRFIKSFKVNTGYQTSKFIFEENGNRVEIPKYEFESRRDKEDIPSFENYFEIRSKNNNVKTSASILCNPTINSKEVPSDSVQNFIISALNQAKKECYICDPYFGADEFVQTVARMDNVVTRVNILTSETHLKEEALKLKKMLIDYNKLNRNGGNVFCRLTKKRKPFKERLIIIDNKAWIYNRSLNEKSKGAFFFSEIPQVDFIQYKKLVEATWYNDSNTIKLEDYGNN